MPPTVWINHQEFISVNSWLREGFTSYQIPNASTVWGVNEINNYYVVGHNKIDIGGSTNITKCGKQMIKFEHYIIILHEHMLPHYQNCYYSSRQHADVDVKNMLCLLVFLSTHTYKMSSRKRECDGIWQMVWEQFVIYIRQEQWNLNTTNTFNVVNNKRYACKC